MAKKTSVKSKTREILKNSAPLNVGKSESAPKLAERIVPIPMVATYSELPFARVEAGDQSVLTTTGSSRKLKSAVKSGVEKKSKAPAKKTKLAKSAKSNKRSK